MLPNVYSIRRACPTDLAVLPTIEQAAAQQFLASPYPQMTEFGLASNQIDLETDLVWVVVDASDVPVGFALVRKIDHGLHLYELDVHPHHARRGLGKYLIGTMAKWANLQGIATLTLTTFIDVAWNAPYYTRLGFRRLTEAELSPEVWAIVQAEIAAGFSTDQRCAMQLKLAP